MEEILKSLAASGPLGLCLAASLWANWKQYNESRAETAEFAKMTGQALEVIRALKDESKEAQNLLRSLSDASNRKHSGPS